MIVATKDDTVTLSGSLVRNQWLTIKAAANLLMREHPQGIIIDCGELEHVSEEGAKTFLEAMRDIQAAGARIMVCNLPDAVTQVLRTVPGVRSQLPIARSVEEARASLRLSGDAPSSDLSAAPADQGIIVPLAGRLDVEYAVTVAGRIARDLRLHLHFVCLLVVARHLPLGAPLPEQEEEANRLIERAAGAASRLSIQYTRHVERVRDPQEGMLLAIRSYRASHVVLSLYADAVGEEEYADLVSLLLHRAPCNVVIARKAPDAEHPASASAAYAIEAERS